LERKDATVLLTLLLGLSLIGDAIPIRFILDAYVSPHMLPSDGDAWTENNNATYPWRFKGPYIDTFSWETDAQNGTYSLRVNHTASKKYLCFYLDMGSLQDLRSYDILFLRFKIADGELANLMVYTSDSGCLAGNQYRVSLGNPDEATWLSYSIPLHSLTVYSGSPSLSSIRYVTIYSSGVGWADGTKIYIDAMCFQSFSITSPARDDSFLPNFFGLFPQYVDKRVVYNGASFTSVYDFINVTTGEPQGSQYLEGEAIGQDIFALSIAYNLSKSPYIGNKLKAYLNWLDELEHESYGAVRNYYSNSTKRFSAHAESLYNGWCLGGLSYYYAVSGNTTAKNLADKLRSFLVDKMWNTTKKSFNSIFDISTGEVSQYWLSDDAMRDGAVDLGLSAYYRFVQNNATVKSIVDENLNKWLSKKSTALNYTFADSFEAFSYLRWGFYQAYKAFNNQTYKTIAFYSPEVVANNYLINGNASVLFNFRFFKDSAASNKLDGWGLANNILLNIHIYEDTNLEYIKNITERNIWEWFSAVKTSIWATPRYKNSKSVEDTRSWTASSLFIYATLVKLYFSHYKPLTPYTIVTTEKIASQSYTPKKLNLTISASKAETSSIEVYVGDNGEPKDVYVTKGALSWSYSASSRIITLTVSHNDQANILIDWRIPGDVNRDGKVDSSDLSAVSLAYGSDSTKLNWNSESDFNRDGGITVSDLFNLSRNYGKTGL